MIKFQNLSIQLRINLACSRLRDGGGKSSKLIRNAKNARGLGRDRAALSHFPAVTDPFPKSGASYFRFARFNTFPL